jgi:hypothetical protein
MSLNYNQYLGLQKCCRLQTQMSSKGAQGYQGYQGAPG